LELLISCPNLRKKGRGKREEGRGKREESKREKEMRYSE
jgi:hypothetical protein